MCHQDASPLVNSRDLFDTKPKIVTHCVQLVESLFQGLPFDTIVDPSAGAGAFSNRMGGCVAIDIEPRAAGIIKQDFLQWKPAVKLGRCLVIGNPPFGRNANLAVKFFNHAAQFSDVIAFIVPRTFRKISLQVRLSNSFHLILDRDIAPNAFEHNGKTRSVPCAMQIWERRSCVRSKPKIRRSHPDFIFSDRTMADVAIQRVGANAGRLKLPSEAGSSQSHYFLKSVDIDFREMYEILQAIDFDLVRHETAGNPSISKAELIGLYECAKNTAIQLAKSRNHIENSLISEQLI